jgi:hypothetical protein
MIDRAKRDRVIIEPFRIKAVEPIRMTTREERVALIEAADFNLFALKSDDVLIDLLTDSGTSAMSAVQQAALLSGDESYAASPSFFRFEAAVKDLMPFKHVLPRTRGARPRPFCSPCWAVPAAGCRRTTISTRRAATSKRRVPKRMTSSLPKDWIPRACIHSREIWIWCGSRLF